MRYPASLWAVLLLASTACTQLQTMRATAPPVGETAATEASGPTGQRALAGAAAPRETPVSTVDVPPPAAATDGPPDAQTIAASNPEEAPAVAPPEDLWDSMRREFTLPVTDHPRVARELDWYRRHQDYLDRVAERARPHLYHIVEEIRTRDLPTEFALLPIVESAYDPFAYSHGRAMGIWQIIPGTGRRFGLRQDWWVDERRDIQRSTGAALDYLEELHAEFDDWLLALAAYNSGEGNVRSAIRKNRRQGQSIDFWHLKLPRETRSYPPKLLALVSLVADPAAHGIELKPIPNEPQWTEVETDGQLDLSLAAGMAGITMEELYRLNPGFNRWATHPDGPNLLLVPKTSAAAFVARLEAMPPEQRVGWQRHVVRWGETLGHLAQRYNTTIDTIRRVNKLRGSTIVAGRTLLIPHSLASSKTYTLSSENREERTAERYRDRYAAPAETYVVKSGDNLWDISRRFGVGLRQVARWNSMATTDVLHPGTTLRIWRPGAVNTDVVAAPHASPSRGFQAVRKLDYRVRKGESLARIAQKFNTTVSQIRKWNQDIVGDRYIHPGQRLTLYIDVTALN